MHPRFVERKMRCFEECPCCTYIKTMAIQTPKIKKATNKFLNVVHIQQYSKAALCTINRNIKGLYVRIFIY